MQAIVRMESLDESPSKCGYISPALFLDWRETHSDRRRKSLFTKRASLNVGAAICWEQWVRHHAAASAQ